MQRPVEHAHPGDDTFKVIPGQVPGKQTGDVVIVDSADRGNGPAQDIVDEHLHVGTVHLNANERE